MSLLKQLFGKKDDQKDAISTPRDEGCAHIVLVPRWDSIDDIGDDDKAIAFLCEACGATLSSIEARRLRATEANRLAAVMGEASDHGQNAGRRSA